MIGGGSSARRAPEDRMPYAQGRVRHDADSHLMAPADWLVAFAEGAMKDRPPLARSALDAAAGGRGDPPRGRAPPPPRPPVVGGTCRAFMTRSVRAAAARRNGGRRGSADATFQRS